MADTTRPKAEDISTIRLIAPHTVPDIGSGDDLAEVVLKALAASGEALTTGDIVVLAQKIVSKSEGRTVDDVAPVGPVQFALGTLAMGDVNATVFAQSAHVALLRRLGAMQESEMMVYRGLPPRGKTWEGVIIDDHVIAAVTRRSTRAGTRAARRAHELFSAGSAAYE